MPACDHERRSYRWAYGPLCRGGGGTLGPRLRRSGIVLPERPLISAVHAVTKGSWGADLALGIGFVLVPLAVICAYGYLARRFHAEVRALVPEVEPLPDPSRPDPAPAEPLTLF